MSHTVYFRLYEELNDYLPEEKRKRTFSLSLKGPTTVEEAICFLGVPPEEVDLVLVNGESAPFNHVTRNADRVSVYPIFESLDVSTVTRLRDKSLLAIKLARESNNRSTKKRLLKGEREMARKKIDETIRQKVIKAGASGLSMRKIAKEYGVSLSSVSRIVKEEGVPKAQQGVIAEKDRAERKKRIQELEKRIAELEKKIFEIEASKR